MYHVPVTDQTMLGLGNKCGTSHRKAVGSKLERRAQVRLECSLCLNDRKMKLKIQQQVMSQVTSSSQPSNAAMGLAGVAETQRGGRAHHPEWPQGMEAPLWISFRPWGTRLIPLELNYCQRELDKMSKVVVKSQLRLGMLGGCKDEASVRELRTRAMGAPHLNCPVQKSPLTRPFGTFGIGPWASWVLLRVGHPQSSIIWVRHFSSTPPYWAWWLECSLGLAAHIQVLGPPLPGSHPQGHRECKGQRAKGPQPHKP